jgi:hypothetical protein
MASWCFLLHFPHTSPPLRESPAFRGGRILVRILHILYKVTLELQLDLKLKLELDIDQGNEARISFVADACTLVLTHSAKTYLPRSRLCHQYAHKAVHRFVSQSTTKWRKQKKRVDSQASADHSRKPNKKDPTRST